MNKNKIRLTESQLHKLVKNSLKSFINEGGNLTWKDDDGRMHTNSQDNWYDIEGATFVWHGEWSDAEIYFDYNGEQYVINATDAEDCLWYIFKEYCEKNNLNPDEHSDDEIWYNFAKNEGYNVLLDLGPYNESYTMNESKYMNKNKIRLTESQLHRVIRESVKQALSELDWKTYANAGKKAGEGGDISAQREMNPKGTPNQWFKDASNARYRANKFYDKAREQFDTDYGYSNGSLYDKDASNVRMGGSFTSSEEFSPHAVGYKDKGYGNPYKYEYGRRYDGYAGQDMSPEEFFNGNQEAAGAYRKADKEIRGYKQGQAKYAKGKGWQ